MAISKYVSLIRFPVRSIILLTSALLPLAAQAQDVRQPDRGFVASGSYALSDIETINTTNGNLMLNIPLATFPKGVGPAYQFALRYDSKLWDNQGTWTTDGVLNEVGEPVWFNLDELSQSPKGGWSYSPFFQLEVINRLQVEPVPGCGTASDDYQKSYYKWKVKMNFPDGSVHEFRPLGQNEYYADGYFAIDANANTYSGNGLNCTQATPHSWDVTYYTTDGSFLRLVVHHVNGNDGTMSAYNPWTLYFPDGSKAVNNSTEGRRLYDRNGNYVSPDGDQFGRGFTFETDEVDPTKQYVKQKGFDGEWLTTTVKWKNIWVYRKYDTAPGTIYCYSSRHDTAFLSPLTVVDYIELPEQSGSLRYTFDYNGASSQPTGTNYTTGTGELKQITLPSGATVEYTYAMDSVTGNLGSAQGLLLNSPSQKDLTYDLEYDGASSETTETWLYSLSETVSQVTAPDGGVATQYFGDAWQNSTVFKGKVYLQVEPDGTKIERIYQSNKPENASYTGEVNAYVKTEFTSIKDAGGTYVFTSVKDFSYDKNGDVTEVKEYDWIPYSTISRTNGFPNETQSGISSYLKRKAVNTYYNDTPNATSTTYSDPDSYHVGTSKRLLNLVKSVEVQTDAGTPKSRGEFYYDHENYDSSNTKGGNLTDTKAWDSFKGGSAQSYSNPLTSTNSITICATYNDYGMPLTTTDANGTVTQITYGNVAGPGGNVTNLYPTQTVAAYGTSVARTSTAIYDFYTGAVTSSTDEDNDLTNSTEYDDLGRPVKAITAVGTALEAGTLTTYDDDDRFVVVKSDLETKGDYRRVATQFYDQLGRVRLSKTLEEAASQSATNETDGIKVQTRYAYDDPTDPANSNGRYTLTSNPYRASTSAGASGETTMGWTLRYSNKGVTTSTVTSFSGSGLPAPWGSNSTTTGTSTTERDAKVTTVTDQAGKLRRSITNAFGQLERVDEPTSSGLGTVSSPNQPTAYAYDLLNNLATVTQASSTTAQCGGASSCSQTRTFTYSSLSRLWTAANPESGTITYNYDAGGNLTSKVDARGVATSYTYDALSRITQRSYASPSPTPTPGTYATTPTVTYTYGTSPPAVGKLTKVSTGTGANTSTTEYTSFDVLGRVTGHKQTTDGTDYTTSYIYNLSGALIEETYPSTRKVKAELDESGDLARVYSKKSSSAAYYYNYVNNLTYTAAGSVSAMQLGNGLWESTAYNARLQPTQIALGTTAGAVNMLDLDFTYGTTGNNGNVMSQTITVPGSPGIQPVQTYTYDELNRLQAADEKPYGWTSTNCTSDPTKCWKQTFTYDRYGNRRFDEANTTFPASFSNQAVTNPTINVSTNRLSSSGYIFDAAGNMLTDALARSFTYDGENKQTEVRNSGGVIGQYMYDGDGKRVKKTVPSTGEVTIFVYDVTGKLVGEYSTIVAPANDAKVAYLTSDHLGSPRINTDANGAVIARHDYHPFGEEIDGTGGRTTGLGYADDSVRQQFTGYERDAETELDFAQARMFLNRLGRFTTADSVAGYRRDPQSLNLFCYVVNQPLKYNDPSGHQWEEPERKSNVDLSSRLAIIEMETHYPRYREWVNNNGRALWVPFAEYAAQQSARSKLPRWTEMKYPSAEGEVTLDERGPNPDVPWGWSVDGTAVGTSTGAVEDPSSPGQLPGSALAPTNAPLGFHSVGPSIEGTNLFFAYRSGDALRRRGHLLFPDTRGLGAERHRWASRQMALQFGSWRTRLFGFANEVQGLVYWDMRYQSRFGSPNRQRAFQLEDLVNNEQGIADANRIRNPVPR